MSELLFNGHGGRKPQTEARRYVYRIIALMLSHELRDENRDGWMFGGVEQEQDRRRVEKAIKSVRSEMKRKAAAP